MKVIKKHRKPLRLGMPVHTRDGVAGRISKVITDPESYQPTYLTVKIGRLRRRREVVVPVALVSSVDAEIVTLNITREALADFPDYEVTIVKGEYKKPQYVMRGRSYPYFDPPENSGFMVLRQRSVPERSISVEKGMIVSDCAGQQSGKVEGVILDQEKRQGKYIIFRRDHFSHLQIIPADLVQDISSTTVKLRVDRKFINNLPEYPDRLL
jgi:sporulation protein YlmC with PRC-barrel domain